MNKSSDLREISGVGEQLAAKLNHLGLKTIDDLIHYYPRRYDDFSSLSKVINLRPGQVTIKVKIKSVSGKYLKRGLHITEALASDESGSVRLTWFNQPYRETSLTSERQYFVSGKYELRYKRFAIYNPIVEAVSDFPINTARIVPRYPETKGLTSADIRRLLMRINPLINSTKELLPTEVVKKYKLVSEAKALSLIHFPDSESDLDLARHRLGFDEIFMMILASELNKQRYENDSALRIEFNEQVARDFVSKLPFKLTDDQRKAVWQVYKDMAKSRPMNRLVEGDVGSGKTAVAAMAGLMAIHNGRQVVFMAPTELLARQHYETVALMFNSVGLKDKVGLLIGASAAATKKQINEDIKNKKLMFVIGTHALIQENVAMNDLALVIIDEQHRFGVKQREALKLKASVQPHTLSLSATPIPRSLALTLFGEMNISRLIEKPSNRQPIKTSLLSRAALARQIINIEAELNEGRQAFIVGSSIDSDTEHSVQTLADWAKSSFPKHKVGIIHGRLKAEEKSAVMQNFIDHKLDILVATTVIEVGIDVPNATIMIVFDAESFGLAQLHQLRGRVGRGEHAGKALLVYPDGQQPSDRLRALESSNDGFKLAELDLNIRGPGAIYGKLQHGALDLRMAELSNTKLIKDAREAAKYFVYSGLNLLKYKQLASEVSTLQKLTNLN